MTHASALLAGTVAALLCLSACGQQANQQAATDTGNEAVNANDTKTVDTNAATDTAAGSSAAPVAVAPPPAPAPDTPPAAAAPLAAAATITQTIAQGSGVERIPYQGGWAWRQNGHIVRTASADGRRVSYFHPGDSNPFLVQQDRQAVAMAHGTPQRAYTPDGRPVTPDNATRRTSEQLAREAVQDRTRAAQVAKSDPGKVEKQPPSRRGGQASPTDTSQKSSGRPSGSTSSHDTRHASDSAGRSGKTDDRNRTEPKNETGAHR